jgi:hypothetical protein
MFFWAMALALSVSAGARAELLQAIRPGVVCMSPGALAKLSLPDGSSRGAVPHPSSVIDDLYRQGDCNDYPAGHIVILVKARRNTSIVRSDTLTGDGVMGTEFVANIDYKPYTPPHDSIDDTIRALCPARLEYYSALDMPAYGFIQTLPPPIRDSIDNTVENECGMMSCEIIDQVEEIEKRHLARRWIQYECYQPLQ